MTIVKRREVSWWAMVTKELQRANNIKVKNHLHGMIFFCRNRVQALSEKPATGFEIAGLLLLLLNR
ncbi:hypothetical protein RHGRI_029914 [Rhododendron griersonianum]|uniref:Uncharacterized protein n=1 Tax=Rhododendron griersonianum TaxID=479676 RepID=A0AAV6IL37_9ERIC|nr:hypothetical protein RHGRI_029914 [Rhododendron griersonianum]